MNQVTPKVWLSLGALAFVAVLFGLGAFGTFDKSKGTPAMTQEAAAIASADAALKQSWNSSADIVAQIRANIAATYTDESGNVRADWEGIYYDLGTLEEQLRSGSDSAFESLQQIIAQLSAKLSAEYSGS